VIAERKTYVLRKDAWPVLNLVVDATIIRNRGTSMYVHERLASEMSEYHAESGRLTKCSDMQASPSTLGLLLPCSSRADTPFSSLRKTAPFLRKRVR
jgi:hypothetical protein